MTFGHVTRPARFQSEEHTMSFVRRLTAQFRDDDVPVVKTLSTWFTVGEVSNIATCAPVTLVTSNARPAEALAADSVTLGSVPADWLAVAS
jgi:hypothetical protein